MVKLYRRYTILLLITYINLTGIVYTQEQFQWNKFRYPIERYGHKDATEIADVVVALQRFTGGWGKNVAPDKKYTIDELLSLIAEEKLYSLLYDRPLTNGEYSHRTSTLDNGATHEHIRFLLRVAQATGNLKYKESALKGLEYLLRAQTKTGGWTQNYPNLSSYGGHVTFNDHVMYGAMTALQEAASGKYTFVSESLIDEIKKAIDRGIDFILNAQIIVGGKKTAWCQQHNRDNYKPEGGRIYELPSICGLESVNIVRLLMRIDNPSDRVKESIISAVNWFESAGIEGIKVVKVYDKKYEAPYKMVIREDPSTKNKKEHKFNGKGYDKIVVSSGGKTIWARFYDLDTKRPFFVGWDGIKKYSLDQIDYERRTGYLWYGYWPESLINNDWPVWKQKWLS